MLVKLWANLPSCPAINYNFLSSNITQLLLIVIPYILVKFQESVISTVLKLCLKSLQEFVRLQTFNRSGFQQIQLDMEFLKSSLKEFVDDEAAISFLLKEVRTTLLNRLIEPSRHGTIRSWSDD